jgi:hypothetical protein
MLHRGNCSVRATTLTMASQIIDLQHLRAKARPIDGGGSKWGNCSPRRVWDGSWNVGAFGEWQAVEG